MRPGASPPAWLEGLLRLIRDPVDREVIGGDLEEGFRHRLERGRLRATLWYAGQVLRTVVARAPRGGSPGGAGLRPPRSRPGDPALLRGLGTDLGDAWRGVRARPGLAALVAATLGLGFGANTAMLSIADAVLFRPLPYPDPDRLVRVHAASPGPGDRYGALSYQDLERLRDATVGLAAVGGYAPAGRTVTGRGMEPAELDFARVTEGFLEALEVGTALGRGFTRQEVRAGLPVVLLSHAFWTGAMGGAPDVVGRPIRIRDRPHTVVGVAAPDVRFPAGAAFWRPLTPGERADDDRELQVVGRVAPGTTPREVASRLRAVSASVAPADQEALTLWAEPFHSTLVRGARTPILVLLGGAWLVLLIACANVANLLLARGEERRRALAMRSALGASRGRLVRLQLLETTILVVGGGLAGIVAGALTLPALVAMAPEGTPRILETSADLRVLTGMAALVVAATLLAGIAPALGAGSLHPRQAFDSRERRAGGTGAGGTSRRVLVAGQVALSTVLVTGAVLLLVTLSALTRDDPGFDVHGVVAVELYPSPESLESKGGDAAYYDAVASALSSITGVELVGLGSQPPTSGRGFNAGLLRLAAPGPGGRETMDAAGIVEAGPDYFAATGIRIPHGRAFSDADGPGAPLVAVVNRETVSRYLGGEPARAVGRRLTGIDPRTGEPAEIEIVGVADDVQPDPRVGPRPLVYLPRARVGIAWGTAHLRVSGDPASAIPAVRRELRGIDPRLPLNRIFPLEEPMRAVRSSPAFVARLLVAFGGLALLLAVLGSYGVTAYAVSRRTAEIGIRRALGADRGHVMGLVLRQSGLPVLAGVVLGVAAALGATRLLTSLLFGVEPTDPRVYAGVAAAMAAAGLAASWVPARRASRVDPLGALRER